MGCPTYLNMDTTGRCKDGTDGDDGRELRGAAGQDWCEVCEDILGANTMGCVEVVLVFADLLQDTLAVFDAVAAPDLGRAGWIALRHGRVGRVRRVF